MNDSITHAQELYRAQAVIEKARRNGEEVGKSLRDHMVSQTIIKSLTGEIHDYTKRKKRGNSEASIIEWAKAHVGEVTNPASIADATNLSYATANKVVGTRLDWFRKIKKGEYIIIDADAQREADKAGT